MQNNGISSYHLFGYNPNYVQHVKFFILEPIRKWINLNAKRANTNKTIPDQNTTKMRNVAYGIDIYVALFLLFVLCVLSMIT